MFDRSRRIQLEDGRELVLGYGGEQYGWHAYVPGEHSREGGGSSPLEAIVAYLHLPADPAPKWAQDFSDALERELREAPRYLCPCCGYRTLLNPSSWEICPVCGWEDESTVAPPETYSGPNYQSLADGRANFARIGACDEQALPRVRAPRPEEHT